MALIDIVEKLGVTVSPGLDLQYLELLAEKVYFKDWEPEFEEKGDGFLFSWTFTDYGVKHRTRKWYVSSHSCESEVIQTMLAAALQGVEHEAREDFKVSGKRVFGPHIHHQALATVCDALDTRLFWGRGTAKS